jgi:hypothetical protein
MECVFELILFIIIGRFSDKLHIFYSLELQYPIMLI